MCGDHVPSGPVPIGSDTLKSRPRIWATSNQLILVPVCAGNIITGADSRMANVPGHTTALGRRWIASTVAEWSLPLNHARGAQHPETFMPDGDWAYV